MNLEKLDIVIQILLKFFIINYIKIMKYLEKAQIHFQLLLLISLEIQINIKLFLILLELLKEKEITQKLN